MNNWLIQQRNACLLAIHRLLAAPVNTVLSLLAIGIALALPATGEMLLSNVLSVAGHVGTTPQISLFMAPGADRKATQEIESRLRKRTDVRMVRVLPREQTLTRMKSVGGLGDVIDALPQNPFPDALILDPADDRPAAMESLAAELRTWPRVEHVQLDSAWIRRLDALLKLGRSGLLLLAAMLGIGLMAITFNTIRLQVLTHRAEIDVSRLLGATDAFISRPFHWFGALQGLLGGGAAWLMTWGATAVLRGPIGELAKLYGLNFSLAPLGLADSLGLLGIATLLGWLGATLSLRQHLTDA